MGGYVGTTMFVVVIDLDRVVYSEVGRSGGADLLTNACQQAISRGRLPPVTSMPSSSRSAASLTSVGLETVTAANGIVVISVAPGSSAARAGIRQGTLLTHLNNIALGGLADDVLRRIIGAADGAWRFTTGDGAIVALDPPSERPRPYTPGRCPEERCD
jgi:S1-C subfamily serine protease